MTVSTDPFSFFWMEFDLLILIKRYWLRKTVEEQYISLTFKYYFRWYKTVLQRIIYFYASNKLMNYISIRKDTHFPFLVKKKKKSLTIA